MGYTPYERETTINMCDAEATAVVSSYQRKWINKVLKAKEKAPNEVEIIKYVPSNPDSDEPAFIEAKMPARFINIRPPRAVSDEQRERMRLQGLAMQAKKKEKQEAKDDIVEDDIDDDIDDDLEDNDKIDESLY